MKTLKNFFIFIMFLYMFFLSGCKIAQNNSTVGIDQAHIKDESIIIKGNITLNTVNTLPDRVSMKNSPIKIDTPYLIYLGYYDNNGDFQNIPQINYEYKDNSYEIFNIPAKYLNSKNLIVRFDSIDKVNFYEISLSVLKSGINTVETMTPFTYKRSFFLRQAAKTDNYEYINPGIILSRFPPSLINKLSDNDVQKLAQAVLSIIQMEKQYVYSNGLDSSKYQSIVDYGFEVCRDITQGIENGFYINEDQAWGIYNLKIREYIFNTITANESGANNSPQRVSTLDLTDFDMLFMAVNSQYLRITSELSGGLNSFSIVDFNTGSIQDFEFEDISQMQSELEQLALTSSIHGKADFLINEIIRFKNNLVNINNIFGYNADTSIISQKTEVFVRHYQGIAFSSVTDADSYLDISSKDVKRSLSSKLGEFVWYIASNNHTKMNTYLYSIHEFHAYIINEIKNLKNITHPDYNNTVYDIYSFTNSVNLDLIYDIQEIIGNYLSKSTDTIDIKAQKIFGFFSILRQKASVFVAQTSMALGENFSQQKCDLIGNIFINANTLRIEKPVTTMNYQGEIIKFNGLLRSLNRPVRIDGIRFFYEILDSITGIRIAYANEFTENEEINTVSLISSNPLYAGVNYCIYTDTSGNINNLSWTDFKNTIAGTDTFFIEFFPGGNAVFAQKSDNDASLMPGQNYNFSGIAYPPAGAYNTNGSPDDLSLFDTQQLKFIIGKAEPVDVDYGPYFGENIEDIYGRIIFDSVQNKYFVVNTLYNGTNNPVCPTQDPDSSTIKPEYWVLDYSSAQLLDISTGEYSNFDPGLYDYDNKVFRFWGRLLERTINSSEIIKTFRVDELIDTEAVPSGGGTNTTGFYVEGILLDIIRRGGRINYIFYNKNNITAPMIMLDVKKQYTNLVSWFDSMSGRIVIIGDPDEDDDSDGITMPVTTAVWNDKGYYDLAVDYNMSISTTNGKPDWAVQVNY